MCGFVCFLDSVILSCHKFLLVNQARTLVSDYLTSFVKIVASKFEYYNMHRMLFKNPDLLSYFNTQKLKNSSKKTTFEKFQFHPKSTTFFQITNFKQLLGKHLL
jgi:hypothetical protein